MTSLLNNGTFNVDLGAEWRVPTGAKRFNVDLGAEVRVPTGIPPP